jgi:hypothetical protein
MKKLISTLFFFIFSLTSFAQTVEELQNQILQIQSRINGIDSVVAEVDKKKTSLALFNWTQPTNYVQNVTSLFINKPIRERLNYNAFVLVSSAGFAEALHGLSVDLGKNKGVNIAGYVGFQANKQNPFRVATSIFTSKNNTSFFGWVEYTNPSDYWYTYQLKQKISKKVSGSLYALRFVGHGVRMDYQLKQKFGIWVGGLYDPESKKFNTPFGIVVQP